MSATIYGLPSGILTPRNDFRSATDSTGKSTASMSFTIRRGDYSTIRPNLAKGTPLSTLYTQGDIYFQTMVVDNHEYEENASGNGMDIIRVNFTGFFELSEPETEKQKVYDHVTSLGEIPTIRHPKFLLLDQTVNSGANGMVRLYNGQARWEETVSGVLILDIVSGNEIVEITGGDEMEWFDCIFRRENRTYKVPVGEYTETQTDLGGLTSSDVANMGRIDVPPNSPATPPDNNWMLTGASETRSSDNPITWTRTWSTIEDNADNDLLYTE